MKKKMAILMTALVGTMAFALVGCKTKIGWLDKKICDHDECKLVEVVEEATCGTEGKKIFECVDCGKKITEKVEKLTKHTDDGEGACEVCEATLYELVAVETGELVAGNTYRLYPTNNDGAFFGSLRLSNDTATYFCIYGSMNDVNPTSYIWWSGENATKYYLEGLEVEVTDTYLEVNLQPGTYKILKNDGTDTEDTYVIDEETTISLVSGTAFRVEQETGEEE